MINGAWRLENLLAVTMRGRCMNRSAVHENVVWNLGKAPDRMENNRGQQTEIACCRIIVAAVRSSPDRGAAHGVVIARSRRPRVLRLTCACLSCAVEMSDADSTFHKRAGDVGVRVSLYVVHDTGAGHVGAV